MRQGLLFAAGTALALAIGCASTSMGRLTGPPRTAAAPGLVVVLEDASPPSHRTRFEVAAVSARHQDGTALPLKVVSPSLAAESSGDTLWLEGEVPPGSYDGLDVSFRSAVLERPEGAVTLEVPAEPARVDAPFVVTPGSGTVLAVTLRSAVDPASPARLSPVLEAHQRPRPTTGLLGLVSVGGWSSVVLFDKRTGNLAQLLSVGRDPAGLALDTERLRGYVAVSGEDDVAVLDLLEGRVRERAPLRAGDSPRDLVVTPDGRTLVVANPGSDTVSFVDALSATEMERVPVAGRPSWLLLDADGRRVFVLPERSSAVTVMSIASRSPIGAIPVEAGPVRARLAGRNGERILVAHAESPYLTVVDSRTLTVERRVYVGPSARALEVDPRSGRIFLARAGTRRIEVFDPSSFLPVEEYPVPGEITWLTVEAEGNGLGALVRDPSEIRILGLVGGATDVRTPLGPAPFALRFVQGRTVP